MSWLKIRAFAILFCASLVLQIVHLIQFLVVFATGIVFQILFYFVQYTFYGTKSPFGLECFVTLVTVALGAAISVDSSKKIYSAVNFIAIRHPILFFTIPNTVCAMIFLLSFACISRLFFTLPDVNDFVLYEHWDTGGAYLICVSFIIYVVVSVCYKDRNFIRDRISGHQGCQFVAFIVAGLLQGALIFGILKPIMKGLSEYLASLDFQPAYILGYMLFLGLLTGIAAGILENYAHCVVHKRRAPFFWYENSVESRTCVLQLMSFPIHYGFCKPSKSLPLTAESPHFLIFAIYSSLALMQFAKILYLIIFDHKNLDVVCGYSNRTPGRERRLSRSRSRSPRMQSSRAAAGQEENNQYYEGPTEDNDPNNNQIRQNSRRMKPATILDGKSEKTEENSDGFLSFLLPMELPIFFTTYVILKLAIDFVSYAENVIPGENSRNDEATLPDFPLENPLSTSVLHTKQNGRKSISLASVKSECIILDSIENGNYEISRGETAKIFSDIHNHVSGDNVQAMASKPSVKLTTVAETKDIY